MSSIQRTPEDDAQPLLADLDRAGRLQRAVLAEAEALPREPAEERLLSVLARHEPASRRRRRMLLVLALAAAAVLLVLGWNAWFARDRGAARDPGEVLGQSLELVQPLGEAASFDDFSWKSAAHAAWYVVVVRDDATGTEIDRSSELEETRWQVAQERWQRWPRTIRWEVLPFDAAGRAGRPASGQASRSP